MANELLKIAIKLNSCPKEKENQQQNSSVICDKKTTGINLHVFVYFLPTPRACKPYFYVRMFSKSQSYRPLLMKPQHASKQLAMGHVG